MVLGFVGVPLWSMFDVVTLHEVLFFKVAAPPASIGQDLRWVNISEILCYQFNGLLMISLKKQGKIC